MVSIKSEIFNLDNSTQLEFLEPPKTLVVIDKEKFLVCKQLIRDHAPDIDIAEYLNIPESKIDFFKYKLDMFEDGIRNRRRNVKLAKKTRSLKPIPPKKREMSSEERYRRARDLIVQNYSTNQISKLLKISERSVTRFKRRMREERKRLKSEGRIPTACDEDEDEFKHLKPEDKIRKAHELFGKNLKISEIATALKISERSVRRWKDRLDKFKLEGFEIVEEVGDSDHPNYQGEDILTDEFEDQEHEENCPVPKKRKFFVDRDKVEYAKELIENKLSNKDMGLLLEMSIACVRKLKMKILNGSVDELIDNNEEYYRNLESGGSSQVDPLQGGSSILMGSLKPERKAKVLLTDRDGKKARLLRENNIRTMDIAKMMNISERSVTRLLAKFKSSEEITFDQTVVAEVEKLLTDKDSILNGDPQETNDDGEELIYEEIEVPDFRSKYNLCASLLSMKTKVRDIAKMLDISEQKVLRWKGKWRNQKSKQDYDEEDESCDSDDEDQLN